jgi:GTP cyclohydrolase FolE2
MNPIQGDIMTIEMLSRLVESIDETLQTTNTEVTEMLGDLERNDSYKKNELIRHLANVTVELSFVRSDLAAELTKRQQKKFCKFWK